MEQTGVQNSWFHISLIIVTIIITIEHALNNKYDL